MKRTLLILMVLCIQVACAPPAKQPLRFTGADIMDLSSGLGVLGDPSQDMIRIGHFRGEFALQLPYATDWVFEPVYPPIDFLDASSPSQGIRVTIRSYNPGRDRTGAWPRVDSESYLRDEILANVSAAFRRRFGVEFDDVRLRSRSGLPVLEYDLAVAEPQPGGGSVEISQHNLWAMHQRDSDGLVLDLHISVTVPVEEAGGPDLVRFHNDLAEMIGESFVIRTP